MSGSCLGCALRPLAAVSAAAYPHVPGQHGWGPLQTCNSSGAYQYTTVRLGCPAFRRERGLPPCSSCCLPPLQIDAFQGHHRRPWTITQRQFANNLYALCRPAAFFVAPFLLLPSSAPGHCFLAVFMTGVVFRSAPGHSLAPLPCVLSCSLLLWLPLLFVYDILRDLVHHPQFVFNSSPDDSTTLVLASGLPGTVLWSAKAALALA